MYFEIALCCWRYRAGLLIEFDLYLRYFEIALRICTMRAALVVNRTT